MRSTLSICLMAIAFGAATAQQIELNDAGGSLTRSGTNPVVGCPFPVGPNGSIDFRIGGAPSLPYILALGSLATVSTQIVLLNNQWFDLDLSTAVILGDGISGGGGLPSYLCATNGNGQSNWSFPANPGLAGSSIALQAITTDFLQPPFNLNITAAVEYEFIAAASLTVTGTQVGTNLVGDDAFQVFTTTNSYTLYGAARTQFAVSTNGFIRLAANGTSDLSESSGEMIAGNPGGLAAAPIIALLWEDLDMGNNATQSVQCFEDTTANTLTFVWNNGEYFSSTTPNWGSIACRITNLGAACQIELDYSIYNYTVLGGPPAEGIIGVSDGNTGMTPGADVQADLVNVCVNAYASTADYDTYFQNFDGTGTTSAQPIDIQGLIVTFLDTTGNGNWLVY
jgi:hypothetical protein